MFPSNSHPGKTPEGPKLLKEIRAAVGDSFNLIGVGGIEKSNVTQVRKLSLLPVKIDVADDYCFHAGFRRWCIGRGCH